MKKASLSEQGFDFGVLLGRGPVLAAFKPFRLPALPESGSAGGGLLAVGLIGGHWLNVNASSAAVSATEKTYLVVAPSFFSGQLFRFSAC